MSEPAVGRAVGRDVGRDVACAAAGAAGAADERLRPESVAENVDPLWSGGAWAAAAGRADAEVARVSTAESVAENVDPLWSGGVTEASPGEPTAPKAAVPLGSGAAQDIGPGVDEGSEGVPPLWSAGAGEEGARSWGQPEGAAPLWSGSAFLAGDFSSGHDGLPTEAAAGELGAEQERGRGRGREQGQRAPSWRRSRTPFEVLADPVEVWIIEQLCVGEHSSGDLASLAHESLGIGWSAVSRHLVTLRRAGFTDVVVDGPTRWHALRPDWLDRVDAALSGLRGVWDEHRPLRELGFTASLPPAAFTTDVGARHGAPLLDDVHHRPARLRQGRGARDLARRGVGRSEWAEETDGGAGLT